MIETKVKFKLQPFGIITVLMHTLPFKTVKIVRETDNSISTVIISLFDDYGNELSAQEAKEYIIRESYRDINLQYIRNDIEVASKYPKENETNLPMMYFMLKAIEDFDIEPLFLHDEWKTATKEDIFHIKKGQLFQADIKHPQIYLNWDHDGYLNIPINKVEELFLTESEYDQLYTSNDEII